MSRYLEYSLALTEPILFIHSFTYISMNEGMCATMYVGRGWRTALWRWFSPSIYVGSSDWIQVIRLCSKHLLPTELSQEIFIMGSHICVCVYICACTRVGIYGGQRSGVPPVHLSHTRLSRVWSLPRRWGWLANESQRIYWLSRPSPVHDILPNFLRGFRDGI